MVYTTSLIGGFFFRFTAPAHTSDRLNLAIRRSNSCNLTAATEAQPQHEGVTAYYDVYERTDEHKPAFNYRAAEVRCITIRSADVGI